VSELLGVKVTLCIQPRISLLLSLPLMPQYVCSPYFVFYNSTTGFISMKCAAFLVKWCICIFWRD